MTSQATLELWTGLARVLIDQAAVAESAREKQLAIEMASMATDFAQTQYDLAFRELLDVAS